MALLGYVMQRFGDDSIVLDVVAQLLTATEKSSDLMDFLRRAHVAYGAQVRLLGFRSVL